MNNSAGFFFGCLFAAFIVFITIRGELSRYMKAIFGIDSTGVGSAIGNIGTGLGFK